MAMIDEPLYPIAIPADPLKLLRYSNWLLNQILFGRNSYHPIITRSWMELFLLSSSPPRRNFTSVSVIPFLSMVVTRASLWKGQVVKKCYMIAERQLSIAWGGTEHYWKWKPMPESRFAEVGKLNVVCWLVTSGQLDTCNLSPKTTYVAYLVVKFTENWDGLGYGPRTVGVQIGDSESRNVVQHCSEVAVMQSGNHRYTFWED